MLYLVFSYAKDWHLGKGKGVTNNPTLTIAVRKGLEGFVERTGLNYWLALLCGSRNLTPDRMKEKKKKKWGPSDPTLAMGVERDLEGFIKKKDLN